MAWANEMQTLIGDIGASHRVRTSAISGIKQETKDLLGSADDFMKRIAEDIKEAAAELRDFLTKSEQERKASSKKLMGGIQARIQEIEKNTQDFISESEATRVAAFKEMMKDITSRVGSLVHDTQKALNEYAAERKEAHAAWAGVSRGKGASGEEAKPSGKKRGRKSKAE